MSTDISTLISNLKLIRSRYPGVHRQLNQKVVSSVLDGLYRCDDGHYAYLVQDDSQHKILIKESSRQVTVRGKKIVILLGIGLGYQLFDIFDQLGDDQFLIAVETRPELLCKSLYVHDWQKLLDSGHFMLFLGSDRQNLERLAHAISPAPVREDLLVLDNKVLVTIDQKPYAWWNVYFYLIAGQSYDGIRVVNAVMNGFNLWDPDSLYLNLPSALLGRKISDLSPEEIYGRFRALADALAPGLRSMRMNQLPVLKPRGCGRWVPGRVSIVVLCWNKLEMTRSCLESLLDHTDYHDFQVIAVDNGSLDGTPAMLKEMAGLDHRLTPVLLEQNRGIPAGRQAGLEAADGEFVLFLDNDTEVERSDFLSIMVNAMNVHPNVGSTGAFLNIHINDNDESLIQCVHVPGIAAPVAWCSGYCLMVRRTALDQIGGMDAERFEAYGSEDVYLGYKLREHNWITVSTSDLVGVTHHIAHRLDHYDYDWEKSGEKNRGYCTRTFGLRRKLVNAAWDNRTASGCWNREIQDFIDLQPEETSPPKESYIASNEA
ncbi:MAG: glycosyltransferase [Candidatus Glassbacteria bacterium]